jgi:hypothetical protein
LLENSHGPARHRQIQWWSLHSIRNALKRSSRLIHQQLNSAGIMALWLAVHVINNLYE